MKKASKMMPKWMTKSMIFNTFSFCFSGAQLGSPVEVDFESQESNKSKLLQELLRPSFNGVAGLAYTGLAAEAHHLVMCRAALC